MKKIYKIIIVAIVLIILAYFIITSPVVHEVFFLVFLSFIVAYTLKPIQKKLMSRGMSRRISALLLVTLIITGAVLAVTFIVPVIIRESLNINNTVAELQKYADMIYEKLKPMNNNKTIYVVLDTLYAKADKAFVGIFNKVLDTLLSIGGDILSLAVIPIIVYYFLADAEYINGKFLLVFPAKTRRMAKKIIMDIDVILGRYIVSQFLLCLIVGVLTFFVLLSLGVEFPVLLSVLNALFNIIPYFGPIFGTVPAIIMALLKSKETALYTALWLYAIQQFEGNILSPKITGESVSMHPLLVIILLIIGGKIGGFLGMVLAVPVGVVIKVIYEDLNYYLF